MKEFTKESFDLLDRVIKAINNIQDKEVRDTIWRLINKSKAGRKRSE